MKPKGNIQIPRKHFMQTLLSTFMVEYNKNVGNIFLYGELDIDIFVFFCFILLGCVGGGGGWGNLILILCHERLNVGN